MKIKKLGHSCLLIEEGEGKLLTDPGNVSTLQNKVTGVTVILISHEHVDHLHTESLKIVLQNNPNAEIFTNHSVGKILKKEDIRFTLLENKQKKIVSGFLIEGCGERHAQILPEIPLIHNTGFLINEKLYFPGDAFQNPKVDVDTLALPICAPWLKMSEAITYAIEVSPARVFPIHDGALKSPGSWHRVPEMALKNAGIEFISLTNGKTLII